MKRLPENLSNYKRQKDLSKGKNRNYKIQEEEAPVVATLVINTEVSSSSKNKSSICSLNITVAAEVDVVNSENCDLLQKFPCGLEFIYRDSSSLEFTIRFESRNFLVVLPYPNVLAIGSVYNKLYRELITALNPGEGEVEEIIDEGVEGLDAGDGGGSGRPRKSFGEFKGALGSAMGSVTDLDPQSAVEKAISVIGHGYDLCKDIRFSSCKNERLIEIDLKQTRDVVSPVVLSFPAFPLPLSATKLSTAVLRSPRMAKPLSSPNTFHRISGL
ncbi:hypothetical protein K1719_044453 [Acacia pycnantha]|nr:hypothetical protein K1719_044453 [Acacia pycnantha]